MAPKYDLGVIVGRFQILHKGHAQVIEEGIGSCKEFAIFVGSSQESRTAKNPFSYEERKAFLEKLFPKARVYALPDIGVGNCSKWGDYVIGKVEDACGKKPDVFFSGDEERRQSWIDPALGIKEVFVPKEIAISSSQMKEYIAEDNRALWDEFICEGLKEDYGRMKEIILESKDNNNTKSL